jgi:fatty-acid desaturase
MIKQQKYETLQRYTGNMAIGVLILQAVFFIIALVFNTVQIFVTFYVLLNILAIGAYLHKHYQLFGKKKTK